MSQTRDLQHHSWNLSRKLFELFSRRLALGMVRATKCNEGTLRFPEPHTSCVVRDLLDRPGDLPATSAAYRLAATTTSRKDDIYAIHGTEHKAIVEEVYCRHS
jgi:hypothetical protein